jgi:flavin reductase (DIM6/NTAB) family NADH-FMN oxidoreductase RutF
MNSSEIPTATSNQSAYLWPGSDLKKTGLWQPVPGEQAYRMEMPESAERLAVDSRWPAFFPSPISLVTTGDGNRAALEKVVGASIVNRFPYVVALSFCRQPLSSRHHVRANFMDLLEESEGASIQFLPPGPLLDRVMNVIAEAPDENSGSRLKATGLETRQAITNRSAVFADAYMVYEARLVKPGKDFEGRPIYETPWVDVGSHRVYFLEITAIQLRQDIANGEERIYWRALPAWTPEEEVPVRPLYENPVLAGRYTKGYTPLYVFPSAGTIAFEADDVADGMAVKHLPPLAADQVQVDNDRARWPCFFPSSAGLITTWMEDGSPNLMPCGSTTVLSRHPMVISPCVSYYAINERYAPRKTLESIRRTGRFGCGVPYIHEAILNGIRYSGNISFALDSNKVASAGLDVTGNKWSPRLSATPIHYDCEVIGEVTLGTHIMFLGEVREIHVRADLTETNPIEWYPWAELGAANAVWKR